MTRAAKRSILVGGESLLIECAQILERHGHRIVAVVSRAAAVQRWATQQGIRVLPDASALPDAADLQPFDYLFSITNLSVLPPAVIALPTIAAINFHDGPLPEYAGLNTPVWALLNRETQHGVTWHLMTSQVDRGDILVQRRFDLSEGETAMTLNTRCFEAGIESFEVLARGLAEGSLLPQAQTLAAQRYYGRKDRPDAAGVINWAQTAGRIDTLVRALDFGAYANPLAAPKALCDAGVMLVSKVRVSDQASVAPGGTVVAVDDAAITVATGDFDLQLLALGTPDGQPLSPQAAASNYSLAPGARLICLGATGTARLRDINAVVASHESFWLHRLVTQQALELPLGDVTPSHASAVYQTVDVTLSPALAAWPLEQRLASLLAWVARIVDRNAFDVGFGCPSLAQLVAGAPSGVFASCVPLRAEIDFSQGLAALGGRVAKEWAELRRRGTYACDLVARTPALCSVATSRIPRPLPVMLQIVANLDDGQAEPGSELTIVMAEDGRGARWIFDATRLDANQVAAFQQQWLTLAQAAVAAPQQPLAQLPLMTDGQRRQVLFDWNSAATPGRTEACVHRLIAEQAAQAPERNALLCQGQSLTYAELDRRANQLARRLAVLGVQPDVLVGLCLERSFDLIVALLAIHKAGGAYVPLDPAYPKDRVAYMLEDSKARVLVTQRRFLAQLPHAATQVVCLDDDGESLSSEPFDGGAQPHHLAYVIYTSGSTGRPKGVMVEHRNVTNFFAGIDQHLGGDAPGTWLAVTSLSFDISVLELCWTLARGYTVVIAAESDRSTAPRVSGAGRGAHASRPLDFSLFYFSSDESEGGADKYRLLLEGAKFADRHGFVAVWTPERHFHAFGGLYPNPAVVGAAIAAVTERVGIRAGSVVLPLHHPVRVAEEWSVVDNISKGRVGISFAAGWQPNDFVLQPQNFAESKQIMLRDIEVVRRLWRGESMAFDGPLGQPVDLRVLPRPVQPELPYWVTSAGNPQTFIDAGRIGANVLTHLLGQTVEELADKLAAYRKARKDAGHVGEGVVSLMLHSFVGPDVAAVRAAVRQPLIEYLRSSLNLVKQYAWSFPAFKRREGMDTSPASVDLASLSADEMDGLLEHSFERYYESSGLFGTPESCLAMIDRIKAVGVDDVACLIDFGVDSATVLDHLPYLNQLRELATPTGVAEEGASLAALMQQHDVTHLQCTPSMARMLVQDDAARSGLAGLHRMMVGGEAFPPSLAGELAALVSGRLMNMYGPTEATVWSTAHEIPANVSGAIPLGRPLANQQIYILDSRQQPLPPGIPGELAIGGAGVVRGYLHRPELTAERFIADSVRGDDAGGRIYRTGDLARWRFDGVLEFLGRLDHQIKLRGFRIELGEIEAVLAAHPGVGEAIVLAREDTPGDVRLVAYVTACIDAAPNAAALRDHVRERLPDYMVPAHFVALEALPQTPNGKVDRNALPAPDSGAAAATQVAYVAPENELQERIAEIWRDVLKLTQIGANDNFFDIGGHSLLAVQAHRRLREALGCQLSITDLFRFPTIQSLGQYLAGGDQGVVAQQGADRAQGRRAAMLRRRGLRAGSGVADVA